MIPIILCGGYSRRMGEDKGLMQWNGNPMVSTILKTLENHFEIAPKLSIRKEQEIEYIEKLTKYQFVIDDPHLNIGGPLKGILSVHKTFIKEDLFLIACDMPLISNEIIIKIKTAFTENGSKEIIVCKHGHRIEPLCGLYSHKGLQKVLELLQFESNKNHSMMYLIDHMDSMILELSDEEGESFQNFNRKVDL